MSSQMFGWFLVALAVAVFAWVMYRQRKLDRESIAQMGDGYQHPRTPRNSHEP